MTRDLPNPRYRVGDVVWVARVEVTTTPVTCPTCLGAKEWTVTAPNGDSWPIQCGACRRGYEVRGTVDEETVKPVSVCMTVGSVRFDTHEAVDGCPVSYMMRETGVGSGSVYYESDVGGTWEEAMARAEVLANERYPALWEQERKRRARALAPDADVRPPDWRAHLIETNRRLTMENKRLRKKGSS